MQSDIRLLLLSGGLGLAEHDLEVELETPVPGRRRIDIEVGFTVIEVKKDLRSASVVKDPSGAGRARNEHFGQKRCGDNGRASTAADTNGSLHTRMADLCGY